MSALKKPHTQLFKKPSSPAISSEKEQAEALLEKIRQKLKSPQEAQKAAQLIEDWLTPKTKKSP